MLLYNRKQAISTSFKRYKHDIDKHNDVALDLLEHFSYVRDLEHLDIEFLGEGAHITECDYCGKILLRDWTSREFGGHGGKLTSTYIDEDAEYPSTDDCCKQCVGKKNALTNFINHGTTKNIKAMRTMEKNGKIPTSRQQIYLSELIGAEMNKRVENIGFVDMVLENDKIVIEYDGSGHYVGVSYGRYTYEEKLKSDYERDLELRKLGYKIIRIHSEYDYLPSDNEILKQIENIKSYFKVSGKEFFKWVIPKSKKDKTYGNLREIKEDDLKR